MKLTFKEKAKLFWERNKADILGWLVGAGIITGIGCIGAHISQKAAEKQEAELAEQIRKLNEETAKKRAEAEAEEERIKNDPANQLPGGGYVSPDNNNLYEPDYPNLLANCVPLSSMGEFGEEMIRRLREEYPDCEEVGPFVPETAVTDVYIDFGHQLFLEHQKWLEEHPESQEKQSA